MGEIKNLINKQGVIPTVVISTSVPSCPHCSAALRTRHLRSEIIFQCLDCKKSYIVLRQGQADNEVICEEILYVK